MAGALVAAPVGKLMGEKFVFAASLLLTALAIGLSGTTGNFPLLLGVRLRFVQVRFCALGLSTVHN